MLRVYRDICAGRLRLVGWLAAKDVVFVFPGTSSFGGTFRGKAELLAWLRRFGDLGPQIEVLDVVAGGPPWNLRIAVRLDDTIGEDYHNSVAEMLWIRWGRLHRLEVFLDTERVTAWEQHRPQLVTR
jgi:ketosteroid isomerase-like protein